MLDGRGDAESGAIVHLGEHRVQTDGMPEVAVLDHGQQLDSLNVQRDLLDRLTA